MKGRTAQDYRKIFIKIIRKTGRDWSQSWHILYGTWGTCHDLKLGFSISDQKISNIKRLLNFLTQKFTFAASIISAVRVLVPFGE